MQWVPIVYPTPIDVGSLIQKVSVKSPHEVDMFSSEYEACKENELIFSWQFFETLVNTFLVFAETKLSKTQKVILCSCSKILKYDTYTITGLADQVSRRSGLPYSTVKWNLKELIRLGLVKGGDENNKGVKAEMTGPGMMLVKHFQESCSSECIMLPHV